MKKRYPHDLSHTRSITMQGGVVMPIGCIEVLPGDDISHGVASLVRATPQLAPIMQPTQVCTETYFVPNRLVDPTWELFITGDPDASIPELEINAGNDGDDRLAHALGVGQIQSADNNPFNINPYAMRAYNLIINNYFLDQDLQTELPVQDAIEGDFEIRRVCWPRDSFTTARLFAQKGDAVTIPIGGTAPVIFPTGLKVDRVGINSDVDLFGNIRIPTAGGGFSVLSAEPGNAGATISDGSVIFSGDGPGDANVDLSVATSVPITDLRFALKLQGLRERRSRYGSRYEDILLSDFGVRSKDSRLQNAEYLGGGRQRLNWSEVLQTSSADSGVVGEMFGHGIGTQRANRYRYECQEHGYLITVMYIRPSSLYTTVTPRHFFKQNPEDYFFKDFEHVGQQPILLREIYAGDDDSDNEVFGYQDRYREYREQPNQVSREFTTTLNFWTFARIFGTSKPVLNSTFITCTPTNRVFADTSDVTDKYWVTVHHNLRARRHVSNSATPRLA